MNRRTLLTSIIPTLLAGAASPALGVTNFWTGGAGDSSWHSAANWSLGHVPQASEAAVCNWAPGSTAIIISSFAVCDSFTNTNQTAIAGGYLTVYRTAYLSGPVFMYGTYPILDNRGTVTINADTQLYAGAIRQIGGAETAFAGGHTHTIMPNGSFSFEGGTIRNQGYFYVKNGGFSLGNYNDSDPLTVFWNENSTSQVIFTTPGHMYDPSSGSHDGGNSVFMNNGGLVYQAGGYNIIEPDIQFWQRDQYSYVLLQNGAALDIKTPVNLDANNRLDTGKWLAQSNSYFVFAGASRYVNTIGATARVSLDGPGAWMYGLDQLSRIDGELDLMSGKVATLLTPAALVNNGTLVLDLHSQLNVNSSFTQTPQASLYRYADDADATVPAVNATGYASVAGYVGFASYDPAAPLGKLYALVRGAWGRSGTLNSFSADWAYGYALYDNTYTSTDTFARVAPPCVADFNLDGQVNTGDLVMLLAVFGQGVAPTEVRDMNGDGVVNTFDLTQFLARFGQAC